MAWWTRGFLPQHQRVVGEVIRVLGHPQVSIQPHGEPRGTRVGELIGSGARLSTGETDRLELQLQDGSRVRLDFNTSETVSNARHRGVTAGRADLNLQRGRLWVLVTSGQIGLTVHTPAGTAEAVGTLFEVNASGGPPGKPRAGVPQPEPTARTTVTVFRGKVRFGNRHGTVVADAGMTADATEARAPQAPRPVTRLETIRSQAPWGQTNYEVWVLPPLGLGEVAKRLVGVRSWLGLEVTPAPMTLDGRALTGPGAAVVRVVPRSPAQAVGMNTADVLLAVGGVAISGASDLRRTELLFSPGQSVEVVSDRAGRQYRYQVALARRRERVTSRYTAALAAGNSSLIAGRVAQAKERYLAIGSAADGAVYNNLGVVAELEGRIERSEELYRRAVDAAPDQPQCHFNWAVALCRIGNLPSAARELEATLRLDPQFPDAAFMLGKTYAFLGNLKGAEGEVQRLLATPDTKAQGLCLAGEIAWLQDDLRGAVSWYLKAAAADPFYDNPPTYLGGAYFGLGNLDEAEKWTKRALVLDPNSVRALNRLALIRYRQGRLGEAEQAFMRAESEHPGYAVVYSNLAAVYLKQGNVAAATAAYGKSIAADPDSVYAHLGLAMALERNGEFAAAKREYQTALAIDPTYSEAYQRLAALHRQLGEVELARNVLASAKRYGL
jgi:tetratricopeptide (TPR) repeat protein